MSNSTTTPCRKAQIDSRGRNQGCKGHLVVKTVKYRNAEGVLSDEQALVCNRCGQAHGRVTP